MPAHPAPLLGEPLPLELANTRFVRPGGEQDGLSDPGELVDWLRRLGDRLPLAPTEQELAATGREQLERARALRDALRTLLRAAADGAPLDPEATEVLNQAARSAPQWPELALQPAPHTVQRSASPGVAAALGAIARDAIGLFSDGRAQRLRACAAPGCMLFFYKDHPRRACCSPRCSNRMRSARHYARHRAGTPEPSRDVGD
jgi:predicted RNA-binding Zn ribbon-like protein